MSVLSAAVIARYSAAKVLNISNPDSTPATSNDTTRLDAACADAAADFTTIGQVVFVETDATHIRAGVSRVYALLLERVGNDGARSALESSRKMLLDLANTGPRGRILPRTNIIATPTSETTAGGGVPRPDFDRRRFDDFVPTPPPAPDSW